jgi:upstream activation factor subunit UAF30
MPTSKKGPAKKAAGQKKSSGAERASSQGFMKEMQPSPELAAVVGNEPLPRTEITKKVWDYIKRNGLQDAKNKRLINADAKLQLVFGGKKQVSMFEMTKLVNQHLK